MKLQGIHSLTYSDGFHLQIYISLNGPTEDIGLESQLSESARLALL
jgi:hypothetical protein